MQVNFKKLTEDAVKPKYAKPGDAGVDLTSTSMKMLGNEKIVYGTGIAVEIPEGMVGLIFPRSSIRNYSLAMSNSVGVIDSGYRGELQITFNILPTEDGVKYYRIGERVAQLIILPAPFIKFVEVENLSETSRGEGGFGSTGV
jgi:dUTP pyrophosphatase